MTPSDFLALNPGDIIRYTHKTDYEDTICEVVDKSLSSLILYILTPGKYGYTKWGDEKTSAMFFAHYSHKFELESSSSLEIRINRKIKQLDTKWAQTQLNKGKTNALLYM